MEGITAEKARQIAIGAESTAVANMLANCENWIAESAKEGYLDTQIVVDSTVTDAVRDRVINILQSRNFNIKDYPTAIRISWGE